MFDKELFQPLNNSNEGNKAGTRKKGLLTLVNSRKNGKRLMLSQQLEEMLELPDDNIELGFMETALVLGRKLPKVEKSFELKHQGKKAVIYSAKAVREIAQHQKIDFTDRVSHTWYKPIVEEFEGDPIIMFEREGEEENGKEQTED